MNFKLDGKVGDLGSINQNISTSNVEIVFDGRLSESEVLNRITARTMSMKVLSGKLERKDDKWKWSGIVSSEMGLIDGMHTVAAKDLMLVNSSYSFGDVDLSVRNPFSFGDV